MKLKHGHIRRGRTHDKGVLILVAHDNSTGKFSRVALTPSQALRLAGQCARWAWRSQDKRK